MKRILIFITAISPLVFCSTPRTVSAEMKSYFDNRGGYYLQSERMIPGDNGDGAAGKGPLRNGGSGYHGGGAGNIRLGPLDLGIEGKYLDRDPYDKLQESRFNRVRIEGFIGFRF
jgi:hypothetical protein